MGVQRWKEIRPAAAAAAVTAKRGSDVWREKGRWKVAGIQRGRWRWWRVEGEIIERKESE